MRVSKKMNNVGRAALSRRHIVAGFMVVIVVAVPAALTGKALARASHESAVKVFLSSIYQHYLGKSSGTAAGVELTNAKLVRSYFTVGLASLILEDRAAAATRGEPPALDGDPFVGHQEWDISDLSIEVKDTGALKTTGIVTFTNSGKAEKVVLELLRSGKDWRIADIQWDSGTLRGLYRRNAVQDSGAAPN